MAKAVHSDVLDGALDIIKDNANLLTVCEDEPADRTAAVTNSPTGEKLADITVTTTDFTVAAGDAGGDSRKVTVGQVNESSGVDVTATATHVALVDGSRLLFVTTCTDQALTSGNDITVNAWDIEIGSPT